MPTLLMPKATAVWLLDNTTLTFEQIAAFCSLHELEVQAIADQEVAVGMVGQNPVMSGQLTDAEIERCQKDPNARLVMNHRDLPMPVKRSKGPRYTPVTRRADKPNAIAWMLKHYPMMTDAQIGKLIGTTKNTINAIRDRTHENMANIKALSPVSAGLCSQADMDEILAKIKQPVVEAEAMPVIAPAEDNQQPVLPADYNPFAAFDYVNDADDVVDNVWPEPLQNG